MRVRVQEFVYNLLPSIDAGYCDIFFKVSIYYTYICDRTRDAKSMREIWERLKGFSLAC